PCWIPGSVQTHLCFCAVSTRCPNREECSCAATEPSLPGHTEELSDQCCEQGHRHRSQVYWCWSRHSWSSWIWSWYRYSLRQSHYWLC
ncbi:hypothetical protein NL108_007656, partial [Boleophthalmus pectinirostris]